MTFITATRKSNLKQVKNLLAQVQLKVRVVGSCHVVDKHQAIPLCLKAVKNNKHVDDVSEHQYLQEGKGHNN